MTFPTTSLFSILNAHVLEYWFLPSAAYSLDFTGRRRLRQTSTSSCLWWVAISSPEHFYLVLLQPPKMFVATSLWILSFIAVFLNGVRMNGPSQTYPPAHHCYSTFCLPIRNKPKPSLDAWCRHTFNCLLMWTILSLSLSCPCFSRSVFLSVFFSHITPNVLIILLHELFFSFLMACRSSKPKPI